MFSGSWSASLFAVRPKNVSQQTTLRGRQLTYPAALELSQSLLFRAGCGRGIGGFSKFNFVRRLEFRLHAFTFLPTTKTSQTLQVEFVPSHFPPVNNNTWSNIPRTRSQSASFLLQGPVAIANPEELRVGGKNDAASRRTARGDVSCQASMNVSNQLTHSQSSLSARPEEETLIRCYSKVLWTISPERIWTKCYRKVSQSRKPPAWSILDIRSWSCQAGSAESQEEVSVHTFGCRGLWYSSCALYVRAIQGI